MKKQERKKDKYGLIAKHRKFVKEYIKDYCGAAAAIRAGYSKKTAREQASYILSKVYIQAALKREENKLENRFIATKEKILKELGVIGFSNIEDYIEVDDDGKVSIQNLKSLPFATSRAIKSIKEKSKDIVNKQDDDLLYRETQLEFVLHDKIEALVKMGQEIGMFKTKCEVSGRDGKPISVKIEDLSDDELLTIILQGRSPGAFKAKKIKGKSA